MSSREMGYMTQMIKDEIGVDISKMNAKEIMDLASILGLGDVFSRCLSETVNRTIKEGKNAADISVLNDIAHVILSEIVRDDMRKQGLLSPEMEVLLSQREQLMAQAFIQYIESLGFNPNNIEQVLELNQTVNGSVSQYLRDFGQFLLSKRVDYYDLHNAGIWGAYGYLEESGLFVPKTLESDGHFFGGYMPKVPYKRHSYSYPGIGKYDTTISFGISQEDNFRPVIEADMDLFIGDIIKRDEFYKAKRQLLLSQLYKIAAELPSYKIHIDTNSKMDSEFIVLSKKR